VYISQKELTNVVNVGDVIRGSDATKQCRQLITRQLIRLCGADYGASFSWDQERSCYTDAAFENMAADNIERYNQYFQFNNPLSKKLSHYRRAVAVSEVMSRRELEQTEFFNDFLQRDGLTYGINLFVHLGDQQGSHPVVAIRRRQSRPQISEERERACMDRAGQQHDQRKRVAVQAR